MIRCASAARGVAGCPMHVAQIIKSLVLPFIFEAVPLEEARDLTGDVLAADRDCYASSSVIVFVMDLYRHLLS